MTHLGTHLNTSSADSDEKVPDASGKCSSKIQTPSTKSSSKTRRKKGEGSGHIYYRTVTRNGKEYRQVYYQWRDKGKQRTKYIPNKLLSKVQEAESLKLPVADILKLLGEKGKCSSKNSNSSNVLEEKDKCSSKSLSPSKNQRRKGEGSGCIRCKPIKRSGKEYLQYWYHYEFWSEGDRLVKKSRYIPKRLLSRVEKLEEEKAPVREILILLGVKL